MHDKFKKTPDADISHLDYDPAGENLERLDRFLWDFNKAKIDFLAGVINFQDNFGNEPQERLVHARNELGNKFFALAYETLSNEELLLREKTLIIGVSYKNYDSERVKSLRKLIPGGNFRKQSSDKETVYSTMEGLVKQAEQSEAGKLDAVDKLVESFRSSISYDVLEVFNCLGVEYEDLKTED